MGKFALSVSAFIAKEGGLFEYLFRLYVKEAMHLYVTFDQLMLIFLFIIALIALIFQIIDSNKKK